LYFQKNVGIQERRYPIHDRNHAIAALRFSAGKPEEAKVRQAVYARYPDLRPDRKKVANTLEGLITTKYPLENVPDKTAELLEFGLSKLAEVRESVVDYPDDAVLDKMIADAVRKGENIGTGVGAALGGGLGAYIGHRRAGNGKAALLGLLLGGGGGALLGRLTGYDIGNKLGKDEVVEFVGKNYLYPVQSVHGDPVGTKIQIE